jgi:serine/threonine-protein kinase
MLAVWTSAGAAGAVYCSYRIETLRRDASEARKVGQYVLRERLGAGGMGEVYRAEHALLRRPCAVKLIRPDRAGDPAVLARFEREVQATAALAHPHIVRIYDYGRADDGTFYCVMEYLPGLTLDALVRRDGPLEPGRVVFLLRQLCSALGEAHAAGLTHRDVKPGNVIVRDGGRQADFATLLDFGLVLDRGTQDELTSLGVVAGTPAFMAPEQAAGGAVDHRADVFAVGAVGCFLLTGRPPFATGSVARTLAAVRTEPPPALVGMPPDLAAVVMRCLAKAPADRYDSADALDAALATCGSIGGSQERAPGVRR